jgi:IclR family acetate operon transcriptional repressor
MAVMPARNYIELVEKTMRVLEAIADADRSLALSEIANRVALVKSSTFRILFTLSEIGYVEKVDGNGAYAATPRLKALARVPASHTSFLSVARARLQEVSRKLHESAWLAEWRNGSVVMVDVAEVSHALRLSLNVGDPCPLHASALGKAIAAHLSPDELRSMLGSGRLPRFTGRTISSRRQLAEHLSLVRGTGYSVNEEETFLGALAIGAPVFDSDGRAFAAVSVTAPTVRCSELKRETMIAEVKRAASAISDNLARVHFRATVRPGGKFQAKTYGA